MKARSVVATVRTAVAQGRAGWRAAALGAAVAILAACASVERPADAPPAGAAAGAKETTPPLRRSGPRQGVPAEPQRPHKAPSETSNKAESVAPPDEPEPDSPSSRVSADQVGLASWYGGKFHRRRTASGELFDMRALTAAHPTLPFGSLVCVRSTVNGRAVVVRINDRGPHTGKRIIDLSRAAAEELGMIGLGLKPVELFALQDGERDCPEP